MPRSNFISTSGKWGLRIVRTLPGTIEEYTWRKARQFTQMTSGTYRTIPDGTAGDAYTIDLAIEATIDAAGGPHQWELQYAWWDNANPGVDLIWIKNQHIWLIELSAG